MSDSIFTKIINGEIPSHKIYEDEHVYAFLDIHPAAPGHTLVVPKVQVEFIWDLDDTTYQHLMAAVKKIGIRLKQVIGTPYVGTLVAGVEVPHTHVHVVPFSDVSQLRDGFAPRTGEPDHQALAQIAQQIAF